MNDKLITPVEHLETVHLQHEGIDTPIDRVKTVHVLEEEGFRHRERRIRDVTAERRARLITASQAISLATSFLMVLLVLRLLLKLIGANPDNAFATAVYGFSEVFVGPFLTLTASPQAGNMILEIPTIIAAAIYAIAGWAIVRLLWVVFDRPGRGSSVEVEQIEER